MLLMQAALQPALLALLVLPPVASLPALSWFSASDTHLGHDPGVGANKTSSYTKNIWAINEMNSLPGSATQWPAELGGGPVLEPAGVTVSGDLIDGGVNPATNYDGCAQWTNFSSLYGLNGTDGLLRYRCFEGRGNHDGKNSSLEPPRGCEHSPSGWIVSRNRARAADPAFGITGLSQPTGLHYSWTWNISAQCAVHFVHLNLFPGRGCGSASNPGGEGGPPGFPCSNGDLAWAENSLGFLEQDLAEHAGPGNLLITLQHYGFDGFSNGWYNKGEHWGPPCFPFGPLVGPAPLAPPSVGPLHSTHDAALLLTPPPPPFHLQTSAKSCWQRSTSTTRCWCLWATRTLQSCIHSMARIRASGAMRGRALLTW